MIHGDTIRPVSQMRTARATTSRLATAIVQTRAGLSVAERMRPAGLHLGGSVRSTAMTGFGFSQTFRELVDRGTGGREPNLVRGPRHLGEDRLTDGGPAGRFL